MKRDYSSGISESADLFIGTEIERTPAYGMLTLFVVGVDHDERELIRICGSRGIKHVYLGANHSFDGQFLQDWDDLSKELIDAGLWVTLDFDVKHAESVLEFTVISSDQFIPQISVKIPYVAQFNYNACIKIDDKDFRASNPGVWVHQLNELLPRAKFTDWTQYGKDEIYQPIVRMYDTSEETDMGDVPTGSDTSLSSGTD